MKNPDVFFMILLSIWLLISYVLLYLFLTFNYEYSKITGFGGVLVDRNNFAVHTVIFSFLFATHCRNVLVSYVYTFLSCILIFASASITGILASLLLILYEFSKLAPIKRRLITFTTLIMTVAAVWINYQSMLNIVEKVTSIFHAIIGENILNSSIKSRIWLINEGLSLWSQFPIFGTGLGNSQLYIIKASRWGQAGMNTHNNYLETLVTSGIIGFIMHYGLLFLFYIQCLNCRGSRNIKYAIGIYCIISISFITTNHFISMFLFIFIIFKTLLLNHDIRSVRQLKRESEIGI